MTRRPCDGLTRREDLSEPVSGWRSWGIWASDHDGNEIFIENLSRAARRASVLSQLAAGRRARRLR